MLLWPHLSSIEINNFNNYVLLYAYSFIIIKIIEERRKTINFILSLGSKFNIFESFYYLLILTIKINKIIFL